MSWNYRVIRDDRGYLIIRQCHYDERSPDVPHSWSATPAHIGGETLDDLILDLKHQIEATRRPILDEGELEMAIEKSKDHL